MDSPDPPLLLPASSTETRVDTAPPEPETISPNGNKPSRFRRTIMRRSFIAVGVIVLSPGVVYVVRTWVPRIWGNLHIVNFIVAGIPTVLSILFAFVIDKDLERRMKAWWRVSIIGAGLLYSTFLWHQQDLTDKENARQTNEAVTSAVQQANVHSDQKFGDMQKQVTGLGTSVAGLGTSLSQTEQSLQSRLDKTEHDLDASIGKVGKPAPAEHPKLIFSLWKDGLFGSEFPLESESLSPDAEGSYHVVFFIKNDSQVQALGVEEWITICRDCSFASEPRGFDKPKGVTDQERHRVLPGGMNPNTAMLEGNEFDVKVPKWIPRFAVAFKATCNNCSSISFTKDLWITKAPYTIPPK